jgi:GAF domain-containing protein
MATPEKHSPEYQHMATDLATALVDVSQMATHGASIVNVFSVLSNQCVQLLPVSAAGILLVDNDNSLHVIGSSSHAVTLLDLFQVQNNEGPCRECCVTHELVASENLATDGRWPNFSALAIKENFVAVYALPLQAQDVVVGALNLFSEAPLSTAQLATARSLADAATLAFLQADMQQDRLLIARKLRSAVEGRNVIEQAKGVLSERHGMSMMEAFWKLRDASNQRDTDIVDMANAVVSREIDL